MINQIKLLKKLVKKIKKDKKTKKEIIKSLQKANILNKKGNLKKHKLGLGG